MAYMLRKFLYLFFISCVLIFSFVSCSVNDKLVATTKNPVEETDNHKNEPIELKEGEFIFEIIPVISGGGIIEIKSEAADFIAAYSNYNGSSAIVPKENKKISIEAQIYDNWKIASKVASSKNFYKINIENGVIYIEFNIEADKKIKTDDFLQIRIPIVAKHSDSDYTELPYIHYFQIFIVDRTNQSKSLPVINIDTKNNEGIEDREKWIPSGYVIYDSKNNYFSCGTLEIKGRGNTSWFNPKAPYTIKLSNKQRLLNMPESKDWVLVANSLDRTLLRNQFTYDIGNEMPGFNFIPECRQVVLYLNNRYQGIYLLTEKIDLGKNKINITETSPIDDLSDIMNGSFFIEITQYDKQKPGDVIIETRQNNIVFNIKSPDNDLFSPNAENRPTTNLKLAQYIEKYIDTTYNSLKRVSSGDYDSYKKYLDIDSFIDFYIIQEISKNTDGNMRLSTFLYKDKGGKMYITPWDFDLAYGTVENDPKGFHVKDDRWYKYLFKDPFFRQKLLDRYGELRKGILSDENISKRLDDLTNDLSFYIRREYEKWGLQDVSNKKYVDNMKKWLLKRLKWLDENLYK